MFRLTDPVDYELDADWCVGGRGTRRRAADPAEVVYDLLLERDGNQLLYMPLFNFAHGNFDDVHEMITAPNSLFGLSDAGAHCGAICDASMTTTSLAVWCRDRRRGERIPLEQMVHHHTQRTAAHVGWLDRGVVAPGYLADLNVIDLSALACHPPHHRARPARRRSSPDADRRRLPGHGQVGAVTFVDGEHTGELPGGLLRGARGLRR